MPYFALKKEHLLNDQKMVVFQINLMIDTVYIYLTSSGALSLLLPKGFSKKVTSTDKKSSCKKRTRTCMATDET
jgi:hypothetical protein